MAEPYTSNELPDVLKADAMGSEIMMDVDIETALIEPTSHRYDSDSGGVTNFLIPPKGVASMADASLVFELVSDEGDGVVGYNVLAGGLACIERISLRSGGSLITQVDKCGLYSMIKKLYNDQDYKTGILDFRHLSSNKIEQRVAPAKISVGSVTDAYHQVYNPDLDQVSTYGYPYNGDAVNSHALQPFKTCSNVAGRGGQVVIRLAELFPLFNSRANLPVFCMASMELEVLWHPAGQSSVTAPNQTDSVLIETPIPDNAGARVRRTTASMAQNPILMMDFINYDENTMAQIKNQVENQGIVVPFVEALYTRGINPASTATSGGASDEGQKVTSNHILGLAGKEVEAIYIQTDYDILDPTGATEIDGNYNQVYTHRNIVTNQFKSQDIPGLEYNFIINNVRIYNQDVSNKALAHHYASQTEPRGLQCLATQYDTMQYDVNRCKNLLDSQFVNGAETGQTIDLARTKPYLSGTTSVVGLNLKKYNILAPTIGNGMRIGSAPIEARISRVGIGRSAGNGGAANSLKAPVLLNFFLEYKRTMLITPLGVSVSDA